MNTKDYYTLEQCTKIFNAIENPKWRQWKIVDDVVFNNKHPITSPRRLYNFIRQSKNPKALYVSVSEFLNPHKVHGYFANQKTESNGRYRYPRAGYIVADSIVLSSYFFVDLDSEGNLKLAQDDGRQIIKLMKSEPDYSLHSVQFSGKKGIHLIFKRKMKLTKHPIERIEQIKAENERVAKKITQLKLNCIDKTHINIMKNVFAVYATPWSIKSNFNQVKPFSPADFMTKEICELVSEPIGNESNVATTEGKTSVNQNYRGSERADLISCSTFYRFVDNCVKGLKNNYIVVIKKHKGKFNPNMLGMLQKTYNLSDFHITQLEDYVYAYCFKLVQFDRLIKILWKAKSENLSYFMSRRHLPVIISHSFTEDKTPAEELLYLGKVKSDYGNMSPHSRPHCNLFNVTYPVMVGSKKNNEGTMAVLE